MEKLNVYFLYMFGKRTRHLNLYTLCSCDSWTCTIFTLYSRTHLQLSYIRVCLYQVNKTLTLTFALANSSFSLF